MQFSPAQISALVRELYQLEVSVSPLPGEIDLNFLAKTNAGDAYTVKIANSGEKRAILEFQNSLIEHLSNSGLDLEAPRVIPNREGEQICSILAPDGSPRFLRVLSWIEGRCLADVNPHTPELIEKVGEMCGKLCRALSGFDHPAAHRFIKWDPSQAAWTADQLNTIKDAPNRVLAQYYLELFENKAVPLFPALRQSVNYNDANDYNILISQAVENPVVPGVIDFGDATFTHTINDLAIAAAYVAMQKPDPLAAIVQLTRGFHRIFPISEAEIAALFPLIGARLLISVTCSAINLSENPENTYLQISDKSAWALMEKLRALSPSLIEAHIRQACGLEPFPQKQAFLQWIQEHQSEFHTLVPDDLEDAVWLDIGVDSPDLGSYADIEDAQKLHQNILVAMQGKPGIGRYNEIRPFYTTDAYAVEGNEGPEWRSVHIGLDVFMPAGTPVYAPLKGKIHSFQDNAQERDYGPTIILEHHVSDDLHFYTLYGHLTRSSLQGLKVGQEIPSGQAFCQIGPMPENGNWSPHLHFQILLDLLGKSGDFPGVAFPSHREVWTSLCPDPWWMIKGKPSPPQVTRMAASEMLLKREKHLGKNLSISYQKPLDIRRGWRQYLFDETGRRYLDTVNNVAHVGHEHPRVVRAGQRQMAVLNTNTRYLHEQILQFTEELLSTFPPALNVAFIVNSGSEANELALRMAKNHTKQKDIIAVEVGYHGNTQACVDISSYKFDGPGGQGAPEYTQVTPLPDTFRGLYRGNTLENGLKYAAHINEAINRIKALGRNVAAFICESVVSCGGQITLPPGYLETAAKSVRAAGGLYIADEVQTGCGRQGDYFWAFEAHGVVPDIVTIGKPIGNGHPLGVVVTTRAIADSFANGMEYFNTFGGNPVSCAIGLEVLRVIREEGLQENARATGAYLSAGLKQLSGQFPVIGDVRGPGLFLGIELVKSPLLEPDAFKAAYLSNRMRSLGILTSTDGPFHNVLKIKPPIVFSRQDADFFMGMLERVLQEDAMR